MTMVGIGIKLLATIVVTFLLTGILTYFQPSIFCINFVSTIILRMIAIVLICIGLLMKFSSSRVPSSAFKKKELVTTGIFSYIRHPMYSSWILFITPGIALLFCSWLMILTSIVGYLNFKQLVKEEEDYLIDMFGQRYLDYRSRVGEIIPKFRFFKK